MKKYILLFLIALSPLFGFTQETDQQLAQHYYSNGEYDKALIYYEKLYDRDNSKFYFNRLVDCLTETGDAKQVEKLLKRQVSRYRGEQEYEIRLAKFYEDSGETAKATKIYEGLIEKMRPSSRDVIGLYNAFKAQGKNEMAFKTLESGRKLLKKSYPLNFQFAEYYGSIGQTEKMMNEYLDLIDYHSSYKNSLQRILVNQIDFTQEDSPEYNILKRALIERTQKNPNELIYAEMLTWLFIQRQNFGAALVHVKAMDKRTKSKGRMVFDLGVICVENKDYVTARRSFKYVVDMGSESPLYLRGHNALLNVRFLEVTTQRNFSQEELNETVREYHAALTLFGKKRSTLSLMLELAHVQAFYANQGPEAIELLNETLILPGLTDMQKADVKMLLADIHVLHGDVWEASLLYMQVDKDFKYEPIGHEAKFKNARIFYYDGEFDFAQSQLDVLKQSTSKLIANDAINLSLLILDNYGLDSNYIAMNWFANADLLIEQHQYESAFTLFDSIIDTYPAHSLGDEIQIKKAHAMQLQGKWNEAIEQLEELLNYYSDDILADDALFQLGDIYENHLMNNEKAAEYYRTILFDYKGSLYTEEARKRFKRLRKMKTDGTPEG
ncbi:MAG: tetratricopeptide repeat protein [Crocinitomicaceae bacterium]|nr:tetratricopeptide repeat protein [Crocinitomicaceae bacterium]